MDGIDKLTEELKLKRKVQILQQRVHQEYENVKLFWKEQPFFYDKNRCFWFWQDDNCCYEMVDETDIILAIDKGLEANGRVFSGKLKNIYLDLIKAIGRDNIPVTPPKEWIQFKDKVFNIKTKDTFKATPMFFFCNPIPFEIGETSETPVMDNLFKSWVGEEHIRTLYEIIAYCCYADYPIHSLFCLIGAGRNGKSRFLSLVDRFIGEQNCVATELDQLTESRFESAKLYKKLVCFMGETNFSILEKTSIIKKLTGQDKIGGEFKGKNPFDFVNYGKLLISSNSLPSSLDTSEGFYRRWMIIDFPNEFPEGKDILETIPKVEWNNLANKVINILPMLIDFGKFHNQGTIEERKKRYIMASNPLSIFIENYCEIGDVNYVVKYHDLYMAYVQYLSNNKKRIVSRGEFKKALELEGLYVEKKNVDYVSTYYVLGLKLKDNWQEMVKIVTNVTNVTNIQLNLHAYENQYQHRSQMSQMSQNEEIEEEDVVLKTNDHTTG